MNASSCVGIMCGLSGCKMWFKCVCGYNDLSEYAVLMCGLSVPVGILCGVSVPVGIMCGLSVPVGIMCGVSVPVGILCGLSVPV